ncbi:ankyrin repeat-containing domain protein [Aspergillus multicolor]|uniref:ankyrin repeat domain-containing protein n=1 Tax=Aspergillus multicolor TaxID=41759 RepID=UPI003CCC98DF
MSPSLLSLSKEILTMVGKTIDFQHGLNAFAQTSKHLYPTQCNLLYSKEIAGPCSSLFWKAKTDNTDMLKRLLIAGYPVHKLDDKRRTPLCYAARLGHIDAATILLERDADLIQPLLEAVNAGNADMVHLILDFAEEDEISVDELTSTLEVAVSGPHDNGEIGALVNPDRGDYDTALILAAANNALRSAKVLIDNGAKIEALGVRFGNPLQAAVIRGHVEMVKILLSNGADANAHTGSWGAPLTAAQFAVEVPNEDIMDTLIQHGAERIHKTREYLESWIDVRNKVGRGPMWWFSKS